MRVCKIPYMAWRGLVITFSVCGNAILAIRFFWDSLAGKVVPIGPSVRLEGCGLKDEDPDAPNCWSRMVLQQESAAAE